MWICSRVNLFSRALTFAISTYGLNNSEISGGRMKASLKASLFVFATMMSTTACENQKLSFSLADNIDGFNQGEPEIEGNPR